MRLANLILGVEAASPGAVMLIHSIHAIEAVSAEEIALGLNEVGRAATTAIAIEIGKRR